MLVFSKKCDVREAINDPSGSGNDTTLSEISLDENDVCNEQTERLHSIIGDTILICAQVSLF